MTKSRFVLFDEVYIHLSVPRDIADKDFKRARRTLLQGSFLAAVRRGVSQVCRRHPTLAEVRVRVMR